MKKSGIYNYPCRLPCSKDNHKMILQRALDSGRKVFVVADEILSKGLYIRKTTLKGRSK